MSELLNALNLSLAENIPPQPFTATTIAEDDSKTNVVPGIITTHRKPSLADKFDPQRLRVSQNFGQVTATQKKLTSVPVNKPNKQQWVRVHPDADYRLDVAIIEMKEGNHMFLVEPSLVPELGAEVSFVTLFTAITREGNLFFWPVKLPDPEGRPSSWNDSAREAASEAIVSWVRVQANMGIGAYEYWVAPGDLAKPKFPELTFSELLSIAFKGDRFIDTLDHPVVGRLRGTK
jgi:hypothetical protein